MPVAESVNFPTDKKPFCRGRLLHVDGDATCCGLLGDNEALHASHFNSRDQFLTKQEKTGAMSFSHHRRKRSSGAQGEEARDSGLELVTCT